MLKIIDFEKYAFINIPIFKVTFLEHKIPYEKTLFNF